jgi:hypothetical protein
MFITQQHNLPHTCKTHALTLEQVFWKGLNTIIVAKPTNPIII